MTANFFNKFYENYSDICIIYGWYDPTITWFENILKILGFKDIEFRFNGFWSQGDGLSFKGTWNKDSMESFKKFKNLVGDNKQLLPYYEKFKKFCTNFLHIDFNNSRYVHSNTMISLDSINSDYEVKCIEETLETMRELADEFYKIIEEVWEALQSKETVVNYAIDNEIVVDKDGNIIN